jgi:hypothetical protein
MNEPLIEGQPAAPQETAAKLFDAVAVHLRKNDGAPFGGCFAVVPPEGAGDPFWWSGADSSKDAVLFYQTLSARIKMVLEALDQQQRASLMRMR